ncbi:MAG: hypothetical protein V4564_08270 [Pseudomonadota bacterium]|uniref:hypothetical protein n=1 Tax=Sphingomonas sp. ERG5 TaxID=1381597 RepID=UPI00054BE1CB|nr:hypothetical protein [Sphingomonas sp. ERG5]
MSDIKQDTATAVVDSVKKAAGEKSFFDQAREAVGSAFDSTVEAVGSAVESTIEAAKENPVAAAAIATGAAAAVAGAAFGISKLLDDDKD